MILWFCTQIFKDRLLPITFHMVPIIDHTMTNRIVNAITRSFRISKGFIADEEIKVLYSSFGCKMAWFTRNGRGITRRRCRCRSTCRNCSRKNTFLLFRSINYGISHSKRRTYNEGSEFPAKLEDGVSILLQGRSKVN